MQKLSYLIAGLLLLPGFAAAQFFDPELVLEDIGTFNTPVAITHAGDGRLFVTEKDGRIIVVQPNGSPSIFLDIDSRVGSGGSEQGLLSTAFHPDYPATPYFFVNYTNVSGNTVIARYTVSGDPDAGNATSEVILLTINQDFSNHNGGQLQFGPVDDFLYVGMGDGGSGNDPNCRGQNNDTLLGKLLRLDVDQSVNQDPFHGIPADNPFGGFGEPMGEVWAEGLRNPWRFSFDRASGDLYIADVGQDIWEEVTYVPASSTGGENYGWKEMEGNCCRGREGASCLTPASADGNCIPTPPACNSPAYTDPVPELTYNQDTGGCSVTGGYVYRGSAIPALAGWYIYSDYCSGVVWAAIDDTGWQRNELMTLGFGIVSFGEDNDGEQYIVQNNTVFRINTTNPGFIFVDGFETP